MNKHTTTRAIRLGQERRQEILDAASALFSRAGFHHASIADIAKEVGISQAGLLHHFPNKAALLLAVLSERERRNIKAESSREQLGEDHLSAFLQTLRDNEKTPVLIQLFAILSSESIFEDHPAHDHFVAHYKRIVSQMTKWLEPRIDFERLPAGTTAETMARWIVGAADGIRLQWLLDPGAVNRPQAIEQLIALLRTFLRDEGPDCADSAG
ncbi:TetR/AcrR family transcriptional regulator [Rhizobium binxianense]